MSFTIKKLLILIGLVVGMAACDNKDDLSETPVDDNIPGPKEGGNSPAGLLSNKELKFSDEVYSVFENAAEDLAKEKIPALNKVMRAVKTVNSASKTREELEDKLSKITDIKLLGENLDDLVDLLGKRFSKPEPKPKPKPDPKPKPQPTDNEEDEDEDPSGDGDGSVDDTPNPPKKPIPPKKTAPDKAAIIAGFKEEGKLAGLLAGYYEAAGTVEKQIVVAELADDIRENNIANEKDKTKREESIDALSTSDKRKKAIKEAIAEDLGSSSGWVPQPIKNLLQPVGNITNYNPFSNPFNVPPSLSEVIGSDSDALKKNLKDLFKKEYEIKGQTKSAKKEIKALADKVRPLQSLAKKVIPSRVNALAYDESKYTHLKKVNIINALAADMGAPVPVPTLKQINQGFDENLQNLLMEEYAKSDDDRKIALGRLATEIRSKKDIILNPKKSPGTRSTYINSLKYDGLGTTAKVNEFKKKLIAHIEADLASPKSKNWVGSIKAWVSSDKSNAKVPKLEDVIYELGPNLAKIIKDEYNSQSDAIKIKLLPLSRELYKIQAITDAKKRSSAVDVLVLTGMGLDSDEIKDAMTNDLAKLTEVPTKSKEVTNGLKPKLKKLVKDRFDIAAVRNRFGLLDIKTVNKRRLALLRLRSTLVSIQDRQGKKISDLSKDDMKAAGLNLTHVEDAIADDRVVALDNEKFSELDGDVQALIEPLFNTAVKNKDEQLSIDLNKLVSILHGAINKTYKHKEARSKAINKAIDDEKIKKIKKATIEQILTAFESKHNLDSGVENAATLELDEDVQKAIVEHPEAKKVTPEQLNNLSKNIKILLDLRPREDKATRDKKIENLVKKVVGPTLRRDTLWSGTKALVGKVELTAQQKDWVKKIQLAVETHDPVDGKNALNPRPNEMFKSLYDVIVTRKDVSNDEMNKFIKNIMTNWKKTLDENDRKGTIEGVIDEKLRSSNGLKLGDAEWAESMDKAISKEYEPLEERGELEESSYENIKKFTVDGQDVSNFVKNRMIAVFQKAHKKNIYELEKQIQIITEGLRESVKDEVKKWRATKLQKAKNLVMTDDADKFGVKIMKAALNMFLKDKNLFQYLGKSDKAQAEVIQLTRNGAIVETGSEKLFLPKALFNGAPLLVGDMINVGSTYSGTEDYALPREFTFGLLKNKTNKVKTVTGRGFLGYQ